MGLLQGWWGVLAASSFQAPGQMIPACLALSPANEHVPQPSALAVTYISMRKADCNPSPWLIVLFVTSVSKDR